MRPRLCPRRIDLGARAQETGLSQVQVGRGHAGLHAVIREDGEEELVSKQLRAAVVEMKAAVSKMRDDLQLTERQLELERRSRDDAERRGRLAGTIGDRETVDVADRFVSKHAERAAMLEQKLSAQRTELSLAERELEDMTVQLKDAERERAGRGGNEAAWRTMESAGGVRPETDLADELLRGRMDRAAHEAAADEQLRELKKKMGK
jgi:hypothetical protein